MTRKLWIGMFTVSLFGLAAFSASLFAQSSAAAPTPRPPHDCRILPSEKVADIQATLASVVADAQIRITAQGKATEAATPPLTPGLMNAVESITADMWPGIPVIPNMITGGTDG